MSVELYNAADPQGTFTSKWKTTIVSIDPQTGYLNVRGGDYPNETQVCGFRAAKINNKNIPQL